MPADLDLLADGVVISDAQGQVRRINVPAAQMLGLDAETALGRPLSDVLNLEDLQGNDWFSVVRPYDGLSWRRRIAERAWYTASADEVLVTAKLHRDRPGGPVQQVAVSLRDAKTRALIDRQRSDLVATVAHELRSPLTGVKGFTSTLLAKWDRLNDSQRLLMLETVDADADRLTRLIAELLDVARIDSGRLTLRRQLVRLDEVVRRQVEPLMRFSDRLIDVQSEGEPEVWVDPDKFAQVFANLVENALRHGSGAVTVTVRPNGSDGAEVLVDDEGDGVPEHIRSRIFSKFWRHGHSGGSGLGLYIVHGIVSAHGGEASVHDSPAGGARMRVTFPYGQPTALD